MNQGEYLLLTAMTWFLRSRRPVVNPTSGWPMRSLGFDGARLWQSMRPGAGLTCINTLEP
jgi:hypothetical protein